MDQARRLLILDCVVLYQHLHQSYLDVMKPIITGRHLHVGGGRWVTRDPMQNRLHQITKRLGEDVDRYFRDFLVPVTPRVSTFRSSEPRAGAHGLQQLRAPGTVIVPAPGSRATGSSRASRGP